MRSNSKGQLEFGVYTPNLVGGREGKEKATLGRAEGFIQESQTGEQTGEKEVCDNVCLYGFEQSFSFRAIKLPQRGHL